MGQDLEKDLADFVGKRADYYLDKWRPTLRGGGTPAGFNWAAFFLSGMWLAYRKMYLPTFAFFGLLALETVAEDVIFVGVMGRPEAPAALGRFVTLVISIVFGRYANSWYLWHAQRAVADVRSRGLPEDEKAADLARRGGTSAWAAIGIMLLFVGVMVAIGVVMEIVFPTPDLA